MKTPPRPRLGPPARRFVARSATAFGRLATARHLCLSGGGKREQRHSSEVGDGTARPAPRGLREQGVPVGSPGGRTAPRASGG